MYEEFYGLREKPFSLTPDPQYLYLSESHCPALKSLRYGITHRLGFMVLTGDIGTGKTTIGRTLLGKLDKRVKTAVIFNSFISEGELLKSILQDLGCPFTSGSRKDRIDALNQFLLQNLSAGENVALIIDEAQNLSVDVLEMIRMLSNLETDKEKMLQIVLLGQLELDKKLRSPKLRQLNQRVAIRLRLSPLTRAETERYIHQRLMVAGSQGAITFSRSALNLIYDFSKGIPRLINLLCDRGLLAGLADQTFHIHKGIIQRAMKSLQGKEAGTPISHFWFLLRRTIPLSISLFLIFLSLVSGTLSIHPKAKDFLWGKIQGFYAPISGGAVQPPLKIEAREIAESSPQGPKGEQLQ